MLFYQGNKHLIKCRWQWLSPPHSWSVQEILLHPPFNEANGAISKHAGMRNFAGEGGSLPALWRKVHLLLQQFQFPMNCLVPVFYLPGFVDQRANQPPLGELLSINCFFLSLSWEKLFLTLSYGKLMLKCSNCRCYWGTTVRWRHMGSLWQCRHSTSIFSRWFLYMSQGSSFTFSWFYPFSSFC